MSRICPGYEKNSVKEMSMAQIEMMIPDKRSGKFRWNLISVYLG